MEICFDIDGVICDDMRGDYEKSIPRKEIIAEINRLYDNGNVIKFFTARGTKTKIDWKEFTENQLKSWGVKYHEIIFGKPTFDIFIDDKAFNIRNFIDLISMGP